MGSTNLKLSMFYYNVRDTQELSFTVAVAAVRRGFSK